jgi:hypothetical protein
MMNKSPTQIKTVAVCFSGEPRTYNLTHQSIKNFFTHAKIDVKYFAHTWNSNTYKVRTPEGKIEFQPEAYDRNFILDDVQNFYNFESVEVDYKFPNLLPWDNLFYSDAKSNLLKREYELANDMTFDVVVKCRFDLAFDPRFRFMHLIHGQRRLHDKTIYAENFLMSPEFFMPNIDDVFYYGTSFTMDCVQGCTYDICRDVYGELYPSVTENDNPYYNIAGPGVVMYRAMNAKNIMTQNVFRPFVIYRKQSIPIDPVHDYGTLVKRVAGIV